VDARSDIFSAGAVVYEMLTGRHPFEGDSPTAVMLKIVNDVPRPIENRELPAALETAVARALEKSPDARYARAADFGRDLKAVKAGMPNPRETATVIIDRSKLNLPSRPQAPAAPQPMPPATPAPEPSRSGGGRWPILLAALVVALAAIIAWYVLSSA
jgi:serine/threonine-protein kinase